MTIADRIRNRRLELGLSVDDLAKLLQKNRATVYRYESNYIKSYSPDVLESLAKALKTTPAYFYGYDDSPPEARQNDDDPASDEIRLLIPGLSRIPREQVERTKNAFLAMFKATYPELFEEGDDDK